MTTTILVNPQECHPNRFQHASRITFTPEQLEDLASVKDIGFIYNPTGYKNDKGYEIETGWRRTCAWALYRPGEPMPLDIRDEEPNALTMFKMTVVENEARLDFNPMQKADLLAQYVDLGATQTEAGRLFNPPLGQAAVSHLLSLRKLPDEIRAHVATGAVPERIARNFVTLAKHAQPAAIKAANEIANAKVEEKEWRARNAIADAYDKAGKRLDSSWESPWTRQKYTNKGLETTGLDWPKKPIKVPDARSDKGEPDEIPPCEGCSFNVTADGKHFCMRPACHALKVKAWNEQHAKPKPTQPERAKGKGVPPNAQPQPAADKAKRDKEKAEMKQIIGQAITILWPQLPKLVEPYLSTFAREDFTFFDDDYAPEWLVKYLEMDMGKIKKLKPAEKQQFVSASMVADRLIEYRHDGMTPANIRKRALELCKEWHLKLPKGWDAAPATVETFAKRGNVSKTAKPTPRKGVK